MRGSENGKFESELSILSCGINVLYLLIWSCFKVKSSLSRADGSKEEVSERVTVTNLTFSKKLAIELNNHEKLKCPGSCPREMFKLRVDRRVICIASGESRCRSIASLFCRVSEFRFVEPLSPQANLYVKGTIEEQSFPYPHQR